MSIAQVYANTQPVKMSRSNKLDVRSALQRAHQNESEALDPETEAVLTRELERIWSRIQAQPSSFTMDQTEFSVFNRYRGQPRFQNETARQAIARYWNSRTNTNSH